jgi:hypothetical protein
LEELVKGEMIYETTALRDGTLQQAHVESRGCQRPVFCAHAAKSEKMCLDDEAGVESAPCCCEETTYSCEVR